MKAQLVLFNNQSGYIYATNKGKLTLEWDNTVQSKYDLFLINNDPVKPGDVIYESDMNTVNTVGINYKKNPNDFKIIATASSIFLFIGMEMDKKFLDLFIEKNGLIDEVDVETIDGKLIITNPTYKGNPIN
jgi:hypothetical protein